MSLITVTGNIKAILGLPKAMGFNSGTVRFTLVLPPRVNLTPTLAATGLPFPTQQDFSADFDGNFTARIQANDGIVPADTVYSVMFLFPNLNVTPRFYSFTSADSVNLNTFPQAGAQTPQGLSGAIQLVGTFFAGPVLPSSDPAANLPTFRTIAFSDLPPGVGNIGNPQSPSLVFAGPQNPLSGPLAPTFRSLVPTDLPLASDLTFSGNNTFNGALNAANGGSLAGTFSGSPTLSGNPVFSGSPLFSNALTVAALTVSGGGSLAGTFSGSPTFSGNPIFSGNPVLSNALTVGGQLTAGSFVTQGDSQFKGPNPIGVDVRAYGVRLLNPAQTPASGGITSSTNNGNTTITLSGAPTQPFVNGDGIVLAGVGAAHSMTTPAAVTVTPSQPRTMTGVGDVVNSITGATTYNYKVYKFNKSGGYTAPSATATITNGLANLGTRSVSITSATRSGFTITYVTSAPHELSTGSYVGVAGMNDPTFNGDFNLTSTADNTHFVVTTGLTTANGATTSATGGTATWFNSNLIAWQNDTDGFRYVVCSDRANPGTFVPIAESKPLASAGATQTDGVWYVEDYGSPMMDNFTGYPWDFPSPCPTTQSNNRLVTTIVSGAPTTTMVLANAPSVTAGTAATRYDATPLLNTAYAATVAQRAPLLIPFGASGQVVTNSIWDLPATSNATPILLFYGGATFNDTLITGANLKVYGSRPSPANLSSNSFQWLSNNTISVKGIPGVFQSDGNAVYWEGLNIKGNGNQAIPFFTTEGFNQTYEFMAFLSDGGNGDYMGIPFYARAGINGVTNLKMFQVQTSNGPSSLVQGTSTTPAFYCYRCGGGGVINSLFMNARGAFIRSNIAGTSFIITTAYMQGSLTPLFTFSSTAPGATATYELNNAIPDTVPHAVANFLSTGGAVARLQMYKCTPPGNNISYTTGSGFDSIATDTPLALLGQNSNVSVDNKSFNYFTDKLVSVTGAGKFLQTLPIPAAPSCAVVAGGSTPIATHTEAITWVDVFGNESGVSPTCSGTTSGGNQTINVTPPAAPANSGITGYFVYRDGIRTRETGAVCTDQKALGAVFADTLGFSNPCGTAFPLLPGGGIVGVTSTGIGTPLIKLSPTANSGSAGGVTYSIVPPATLPTVSRTLTLGDGNPTFPNNNGIVPVSSYLNSAYDNFNRANGGVGSNWTVVTGTGFTITSNQVGSAGANHNSSMYNVNQVAGDQFAEVTIVTLGTASGVGARLASGQGYACLETSSAMQLDKNTAGTWSLLTGPAITGAVGDVVRIEVVGNTITCYQNGVSRASTTDSAYTTGNPGIHTFGTTGVLDNFSGGNLHPIAQLDVEQDWTQPQHFIGPVTIGPVAPIAGSLAANTLYVPSLIVATSLTLNEGTVASGVSSTGILSGSSSDHLIHQNPNNVGDALVSYRKTLTSTYTNATTTPSNISGLSFTVAANVNYAMTCHLYYQGSAGTAGLDIAITGPASPTNIFYSYDEDATGTSLQDSVANAFGTKLTGNTTVTATTNLHATVTMGLMNGANAGTVQVQGSATGTGTVTIQPGSFCTIH